MRPSRDTSALGRRISKAVENSGDWNATYHYYYDGQRMIETRDLNDQVLKQHVWGLTYVDELVQITINQDPENAFAGTNTENLCERSFWALQDANFNVIGLVNHSGLLIERYEYTPYGQRTVFSRDWLLCDLDGDGVVEYSCDYSWFAYGSTAPDSPGDFDGDGVVGMDDFAILEADRAAGPSSAADDLVCYPRLESCRGWSSSGLIPLATGLCDVGHQGLHLDKEFGLYDNRARYLNPRIARMLQPDPTGYADGMNRFEYVRSAPVVSVDPSGLSAFGIKEVQWWIENIPGVDAKTKFMLKQLKQKNVKMYMKNSWFWDYDGEEDYIWIDCDFNGRTEATRWYEDGMREWANNNKHGAFRQIVRDYALAVKAKGGDAVKVLADTYDFAHKWTRYPSQDSSGDMMDSEGMANATLWAFAGRTLYSGTTADPLTGTEQGTMSKFYYEFVKETPSPGKDQTHHFAAYFTLGATVRAPVVVGGGIALVSNDTPVNNPGDFLLAVVGVRIGQSYRSNPRYMGSEITRVLQADPKKGDRTIANMLWNAAVHHATTYLGQ